MLLRYSAAAALMAALAVMPAQAKAPCYAPAEFEAEQAIRLHTEMMVVGLTCQHMDVAGQPSLFAQYKLFTLHNSKQVERWEKALIAYYKRTVKGNPNRAFDTFRTRLANETSQRAIALTTPVFCAEHVPAVQKAMATDLGELVKSFSPDAPGVRVAQEVRCDKPLPPSAIADAQPTPPGRAGSSAVKSR